MRTQGHRTAIKDAQKDMTQKHKDTGTRGKGGERGTDTCTMTQEANTQRHKDTKTRAQSHKRQRYRYQDTKRHRQRHMHKDISDKDIEVQGRKDTEGHYSRKK